MRTTAEILRGLPYFSDLPEELLSTVCDQSKQIDVEAGKVIIEEDSTSEEMYVLVEGELVVTKLQDSRHVELARIAPGEVVGELALLDKRPRIASVSASIPSRLVRIPAEAFETLLEDSRVVRRMVGTVTSRLRSTEEVLRHEERMAALGRMAAQLMHELNNPAAAVGRASQELARLYEALTKAVEDLLPGLSDKALAVPATPASMTNLERLEAESSVEEWLTEHDVEEPWELAAPLVAAGWNPGLLDGLIAEIEPELAPRWVRLTALRANAGDLIREIGIGAKRISELVRVVKHYSFLDQAPVQEVLVTEGIDDTLILLRHKLRGIEVVRAYEADVAKVEASGRDLNQVWTNLIDNAADALDGKGSLKISVNNEDGSVVIGISDTGPGIPAEIMSRLFDPFFTTKEPGKGTGLGLHTVHTILTRAGGKISVASDGPGTTFTVTLPAVGTQT
ncbi:MAG TPA: ATP-binding protein [Acidimicrobiia bacterium]|nr:ATP-binding protein [Acidimicrobiia bacterium]